MENLGVIFCIFCMPLQQLLLGIAYLHNEQKQMQYASQSQYFTTKAKYGNKHMLNHTNHDSIHSWNAEQLGIISRITTSKSVKWWLSLGLKLFEQIGKSLTFASTIW